MTTPPPVFLPPADVQRITGKVRYTAQRRALDRLGIPYTLADGGEPLVRQADLDGKPKPARNRGPRWDLLNSA